MVQVKGNINTDDSYVIDFGEIKIYIRQLCRTLDEHFLVPELSSSIKIKIIDNKQLEMLTIPENHLFSFPIQDCLCLPIRASTVEELSIYFTEQLVKLISLQRLQERKITELTVGITETPGQQARYTYQIPPLM